MNCEKIRQAAFEDEMQKIGASARLLESAGAKAKSLGKSEKAAKFFAAAKNKLKKGYGIAE